MSKSLLFIFICCLVSHIRGQELKEKGIREDIVVLVGGAPLNDAFAEDIEADAYCRDASVAVETAKKFMDIKKGNA